MDKETFSCNPLGRTWGGSQVKLSKPWTYLTQQTLWPWYNSSGKQN